MSILMSGDLHANARGELDLVTKENLCIKFGEDVYNSINYHIILGDGGFMWRYNRKSDEFIYKKFAERPFPVLCVMGNHEPIYGKRNIPEDDIGIGEKVYRINDNPYAAYLKRGKIYQIDGIKFLALGGALSIDKYSREKNETWWENEYWSDHEKMDLFNLLDTDNSFDCVISHTGPLHINIMLFHNSFPVPSGSNYDKINDEVAKLNDEVHKKIKFYQWWCGHYHNDVHHNCKYPRHSYQYLYRTAKIMDKVENKLRVHNEYDFN